jgi:hypothetical protein
MKVLSLCGALLCALLLPGVASAECANNTNPGLIHNGGFETGNSTTISEWDVGDTTDPGLQITTTEHKGGVQSLRMGSNEVEDRIFQGISGTTAGSVYTICFYLANASSDGTSSFRAQWNNQDLVVLRNSRPFGFTYYAFDVVATGNDVLSFEERNDQAFYYLDNVDIQLCGGCSVNNGPNAAKKAASFAPFKR